MTVGWTRMLGVAALCAALVGCGQAPGAQRTELNAESRLRVGEAAERSGDMDTAVSMYTAAAENAPEDASVQVRAAQGLARAGKWNQARDLLLGRVKLKPRDPDLLRALASIYVMVGQSRVAIARYDEVLAIAPGDVNAIDGKAVALDLAQRHGEAQAVYRRALTLAPEDPIISNNLALSLLMEGRLREAQDVLAPFAEAEDVPERLKINLGIIYAANGDAELARRLLEGHVGDADLQSLTRAVTRGRPALLRAP